MYSKPKSLNEIWLEDEVVKKLGLKEGETGGGRNRTLSKWIKGGLKHIERGERRYFVESDLIEYLLIHRK